MAPHLGLIQAKAVTSPGKWLSCIPFTQWPWCGQTSGVLGMGGATCEIATSDIHQGRHWHQAASLLTLQKCPLLSPASWWWPSLLYDCHISG